ncbi:MAG: TolC family protein [Sphingomonadales bacterium]|nr:TolC family protein [Sphingomonadales bacterium]
MKKNLLFGWVLTLAAPVLAQTKWDLKQCVDYAIQHNISVRQTDLQSRFSQLTYLGNKAGQLPTLNFGSNAGYRLGRSENPTTGVLEDNNFFNVGMQMQSSVSLFNWFAIKKNREASRLNWEADKEQTRKIMDDISLNVAVSYLQLLLAREQAKVAGVQVEQVRAQLNDTRKRVDAGVLPEINAAELEAQLARDSASLITAQTSSGQLLLQLKALLNLDAGAEFDIAEPPVQLIPVMALADLQPEAVYQNALSLLPQQKVNRLRIQSAQQTIEAARARLLPSFSAFGSINTNAIRFKKEIYNQVLNGYVSSGARVNAGGVFFPVEVPSYSFGNNVVGYFKPDKVGSQFNTNLGQSVGIGMNLPIFNGRSARLNVDRSKLNLEQLELQLEQGERQLKQDIYRAYNDAVAALQKNEADKKSLATAEKAYSFATRRYDLTLLSAFELINSQGNLQRARIQAILSRYDFVFKMKLLEFYRGQGIRLQ